MLGEILRKLRKKRNLTQKQIADFIKVSQQTYAKYENGTIEPNIDNINALSQYFDISTDYLLGREDKKAPTEKVSASEIEALFAQNGITPEKLNSLPDNKKELIMSLVKDMIDSSNK